MKPVRWLLDLITPRLWFDDVTRKDGERRALRVIYDKPERDEIKPSCVHLYSDADELAAELKRQSNVTAFTRKARGSK